MRRYILITLTAALLAACANSGRPSEAETTPTIDSIELKGDSTIYGLACDGCTDSVIVFLPNSGGDPVTYDILAARRQGRVLGHPRIGDNLAILVDATNQHVATSVVNIDELKGTWVYQVMPHLRVPAGGPSANQQAALPPMPDSLLQALMSPREYGFKLKRGNSIQSVGMRPRAATSDDDSPVEYPEPTRYSAWCLFNGRIILRHAAAPANTNVKRPAAANDTAEIVLLMKDSLVLRFNDHTQGYYRKE